MDKEAPRGRRHCLLDRKGERNLQCNFSTIFRPRQKSIRFIEKDENVYNVFSCQPATFPSVVVSFKCVGWFLLFGCVVGVALDSKTVESTQRKWNDKRQTTNGKFPNFLSIGTVTGTNDLAWSSAFRTPHVARSPFDGTWKSTFSFPVCLGRFACIVGVWSFHLVSLILLLFTSL